MRTINLGVIVARGLIVASIIFTSTYLPMLNNIEVHAKGTSEKTHTVKRGDSLYGIAKKNKVSVSELKAWNVLESNTIKVGQILKVNHTDVKRVHSSQPAWKTYTVNKGDTLYRISLKNKVKVGDLIKWNKIQNNTIYVGQKIKIQSSSIQKKSKVIPSSYTKVRYFHTNIHVYISASNAKLAISKGKGDKLEPLSKIKVPNEVAKINMGMFDPKGKYEHGGMYVVNGKINQEYQQRHIALVYDSKGRIDVKDFGKTMDEKTKKTVKQNNFVVGTSYSLIQDGKKNLQNQELFTHSDERNPRTMFGQMKDGRFILAVTDGRVFGSKGLTASQSADVMLKLGAIEAVNMDGGGSSTLIVGGKIKNVLLGSQRDIGSAMFITQ